MSHPTAELARQLVDIVDSKYNGNIRCNELDSNRDVNLICQEIAKSVLPLVDQETDPFSDQYTASQINVYSAISGRKLDQNSSEILPVDLDPCRIHSNPYGSVDFHFISRYQYLVSAVMRTFSSIHSGRLRVLDMGCGRGLTSEILAIAGAEVVGLDVDPKMKPFSEQRAIMRGYSINRITLQYDDIDKSFSTPNTFDLVLFCASLHHAVKPWLLLRNLSEILSERGAIFITQEPVNRIWWKHWGIRLDRESIYVASKYGWFESGFSASFLKMMAHRCCLEFELMHNAAGDHIGFYCIDVKMKDLLANSCSSLGFSPMQQDISKPLDDFRSEIQIITAPESCNANGEFDVVVSVRNIGTEPWLRDGDYPVRFSYHWHDLEGASLLYNGTRTLLPVPCIHPNEHYRFNARVHVPNYSGQAILALTLVQEGVNWFEDRGSLLRKLVINIKTV
jgi:2-polyprenyl-3-methyl-5-hydroxy-6-metoxy-1,4-benzoquinol methylase